VEFALIRAVKVWIANGQTFGFVQNSFYKIRNRNDSVITMSFADVEAKIKDDMIRPLVSRTHPGE